MGEIGRRFNPEALSCKCQCRICVELRAARQQAEQAPPKLDDRNFSGMLAR
jgi:hypothetical protein